MNSLNYRYKNTCKYKFFIMDPNEHTKYLFYSSFLMGASSLVCFYYKDYPTFFLMSLLFLTSIHHWNNPSYGWKRTLDMVVCKVLALYLYGTTLIFYDEFYHYVYLGGFYSSIFFFFLANRSFRLKSDKWIVFQMMIHFYTFFTPFVLYML